MHELRPDVTDGEQTYDNQKQSDELVFAPTDSLDDRDSASVEFTVDEELSCSNTDFGGSDPAQ